MLISPIAEKIARRPRRHRAKPRATDHYWPTPVFCLVKMSVFVAYAEREREPASTRTAPPTDPHTTY
jgi:hypothetical protein